MNRDPHVKAEIFETDLEKSIFTNVPNQNRRYLPNLHRDLGETQLVHQMILQGDRLDDRVHHELMPLIRVVAFRRADAGLCHVFPPLFIELGKLGEFAIKFIVFGVRTGILQRDVSLLLLKSRIYDQLLLNELAQLERGGLEQLQALLHLRRNRLLLQEGLGLIEPLLGHNRGCFHRGLRDRSTFRSKP